MRSFIHEIQNIKPRYEQRYRESIIDKFSTVRGTVEDRPVFSQLWQCYAWAGIIGFINNRKRSFDAPTNTSFDFSVISNNGPIVSKALICLALAKAPNGVDCLKDPAEIISIIEQYTNGGFDIIAEKLIEKGEHYFDSFDNFLNDVLTR